MFKDKKHTEFVVGCLTLGMSLGIPRDEAKAIFYAIAEVIDQLEKTPDALNKDLNELAKAIFNGRASAPQA